MSNWQQLGLSIGAGSLTTLSPCVFPLLPLVLGGAVQKNRAAPLAMGLGMVISFAAIGVIVGVLGDAIGLSPDRVRVFAAALLITFGLVMLVPALNERFTAMVSPLASGANAASARLDGGSMWSALAMGGLLGLIWSPCSGPLLGSALTLVASEGGAARGALILGLFGLGAAIPLVAAAYASRAGFGRVRQWVLRHGEQSKKLFGALLLLVGLVILSGADKWLETQVNERLPDAWLLLTTRW
jgi:cytochrome c biogenesis protein CcdA